MGSMGLRPFGVSGAANRMTRKGEDKSYGNQGTSDGSAEADPDEAYPQDFRRYS